MSAPPVERLQRLASRTRRPAFGVAGQLLNAGTNVATTYVASLLMRRDEFGAFVLVFAVVTIVLATGRGLIGSTMLVHLPAQDEGDRESLVRSALGFTVLAGLAASVLVVPIAVAQPVLWWFAPWVTVALLQDVGRYVLLAEGRTGRALGLDVAWAVVQALVLGVGVTISREVTIGLAASAWGLGAAAGLAAFAVVHGLRPAHPRTWTRATRDLAGWFTAVAVVGQCEIYLVLLLAGAVLGPVDVAGVRAVQLLAYQPALLLVAALIMVLQPRVVRARSSAGELRRVWRLITVMTTPVLVGLALVVVLHDPLMRLILPPYVEFASLVVPVALQCAFAVLGVAPQAVLRGLRQGALNLSLVLVRIALLAGAGVTGMVLAGVDGLAWGMVVASAVALVHVSWHARRAIARVGAST